MKLELKENMYCRSRGGAIRKIVSLEDFNEREYKLNGFYIDKNAIVKVSYNIIDILEVGDYVNGFLIDYVNLKCETPFLRSERPYRVDNTLYSTLKEKGRDYNQPLHFYNEDIKTIVTKEQFEQMAYKVGE